MDARVEYFCMTTLSKNDPLLPVYLINGEDVLKREIVLKKLKTRLAASGDLAFNYDSFSGESASAETIIASCITLPFASDVRLVQVNNADKLKKADTDKLIAYLKAPTDTTVLALVAEKLSEKSALFVAVKAFGAKATISCLPQKRYELVKTLRSIARGHGVAITEGAAQALIDLVGENTVYLDSELKKIALAHFGPDSVTEEEVRFLVSRTNEVKSWEFLDAFAARDVKKCVTYLGQMESTSPLSLLGRCVGRVRELICARALNDRGSGAALGATLKMPDWKVKNHLRWAQGFTSEELRWALINARDCERAMKSGTDQRTALLDWVLGTIVVEIT